MRSDWERYLIIKLLGSECFLICIGVFKIHILDSKCNPFVRMILLCCLSHYLFCNLWQYKFQNEPFIFGHSCWCYWKGLIWDVVSNGKTNTSFPWRVMTVKGIWRFAMTSEWLLTSGTRNSGWIMPSLWFLYVYVRNLLDLFGL